MYYEFKTKPYDHQKTALERSGIKARSPRPAFAWLMEMGTGKSKVDCDEAGMMYALGLINLWIIAAPKGVYNNWVREGGELQTHMSVPYTVAKWQAGGGNASNKRMLEKLVKPEQNSLRILVINIESMSSGKLAFKYVEKLIKSAGLNADGKLKVKMSIDEATKIKNPESARTENWTKLGKECAFRRTLTGSPITKNPLDAYGQFTFLDPKILGHNSWYSFKARYAIQQERHFGTRKAKVIVGFRNQDELKTRIADHSYRVLKEDCLDLPPKVYTSRDVELTDEQHSIYAQMRDQAFADLGGQGFATAQNAITILMKLQQIVCGHVKDADGTVHRLPTNRIDVMMETIEETNEDVIIWSRYREDIDRICESLRKEYGENSVSQYHGGNTRTRDEEAERFIRGESRFIVSTQQSGGYGNTWLNGRQTIYYSNSEDLEHRLQSEDRPHRSGQRNTCTYTDLITPGTIQAKMVKSLRAKMDIASEILGDDPREWLI